MATQTYELPKFEMPKFPGVDADAFVAAQRRNMEAFQSAGQILADGARTFTQRQTEMMQAHMTGMSARTETMMKPEAARPEAFGAQVQLAKTTYEQMLSDARELMEIVTKAQSDAMQVMNQAVLANLEEMKKMAA